MKKKITKEEMKKIENTLSELRQNLVLVEGKRDKEALESLGCKDVIAVAGRKNQIRDIVSAKKVIVATDLDQAGNELAKMIKEELEGDMQVDCETRIKLAKLLQFRYFEDIKKRYEKVKDEVGE
ncbi:MAG: toprim domain-containing protein [Candidatus Bilamarchaeaceae archaeon]